MASKTKIPWAGSTWSPWFGCTQISPGCDNCYAKSLAERFKWTRWGAGEKRLVRPDKYWQAPLAWERRAAKKGKRRFVFPSMCDPFDPEAPSDTRERFWKLIDATPHLTWLLLTKRPERIADTLPADWGDGYPNVWLGVTVEARDVIDRVAFLRNTPAALRFVSCEPMLDDLRDDHWSWMLSGKSRIGWVIVGCESGRGARPFDSYWARCARDACAEHGVPFFYKQARGEDGRIDHLPTLDGKTYREVPDA